MTGVEWIVEAHGCSPAALRDLNIMRGLFEAVIADMNLHPVGEQVWHQFAEPGGITGVCVLAESHLACHTFPEFGAICLNLFCCRERPAWDFKGHLQELLNAGEVTVRRIERNFRTTHSAKAHSGAES